MESPMRHACLYDPDHLSLMGRIVRRKLGEEGSRLKAWFTLLSGNIKTCKTAQATVASRCKCSLVWLHPSSPIRCAIVK